VTGGSPFGRERVELEKGFARTGGHDRQQVSRIERDFRLANGLTIPTDEVVPAELWFIAFKRNDLGHKIKVEPRPITALYESSHTHFLFHDSAFMPGLDYP
jgi:hypothetical protein